MDDIKKLIRIREEVMAELLLVQKRCQDLSAKKDSLTRAIISKVKHLSCQKEK